MATYYYTAAEDGPAVYHNNQDCKDGSRIERETKIDTDIIPTHRTLCEFC